MGKPIDCSTEEGKSKVLQILEDEDKSYFIDADDMEDFNISLCDLAYNNWNDGYILENVAYGVVESV